MCDDDDDNGDGGGDDDAVEPRRGGDAGPLRKQCQWAGQESVND